MGKHLLPDANKLYRVLSILEKYKQMNAALGGRRETFDDLLQVRFITSFFFSMFLFNYLETAGEFFHVGLNLKCDIISGDKQSS